MKRLIASAALSALTLSMENAPTSGRASGTFEVKVEPITTDGFPRMKLTKQFAGDLVGTSEGEMMAFSSPVKDSGAYVAIERVSGSLGGRKGTFALVHSGTMRRGGEFKLTIRVVPDSGTEELTGLTGTMEIIIEGKKHFYKFDYAVGE